jgi:hypothetical protein
LCSKCKAPSSNPRTAKRKTKKSKQTNKKVKGENWMKTFPIFGKDLDNQFMKHKIQQG